MSACSYSTAMVRLTNPDSPMAVYRITYPLGSIGVCFAETVESQRKIRDGWPELIGVFDRTADMATLREIIRANLAIGGTK